MNTRSRHPFLLFAVAGVIGLAVDTAVLYALAPWLGWSAARVFSFIAAATTTWWVNRNHAFGGGSGRAESLPSWQEYRRYLLAMAFGGCVNYAAFLAVLHWIKVPGAAMLGVAAGSCCGLVFNFAASRYLVFTRQHPKRLPCDP